MRCDVTKDALGCNDVHLVVLAPYTLCRWWPLHRSPPCASSGVASLAVAACARRLRVTRCGLRGLAVVEHCGQQRMQYTPMATLGQCEGEASPPTAMPHVRRTRCSLLEIK